MKAYPQLVTKSHDSLANGGTTNTDPLALSPSQVRVQAFVAGTQTFAAWLEYTNDGTNWITAAYAAGTDATTDALYRYVALLPSAPACLSGVQVRVRLKNTSGSAGNYRIILSAAE